MTKQQTTHPTAFHPKNCLVGLIAGWRWCRVQTKFIGRHLRRKEPNHVSVADIFCWKKPTQATQKWVDLERQETIWRKRNVFVALENESHEVHAAPNMSQQYFEFALGWSTVKIAYPFPPWAVWVVSSSHFPVVVVVEAVRSWHDLGLTSPRLKLDW